MASETFESWLLIPGNHRVILDLKKQLTEILNKPIKIDSWRTLYEYFEMVLKLDLSKVKIFESIFLTHPPTIESGASDAQEKLFEQYTQC